MERKGIYLAAVMLFCLGIVVQAQPPVDELHGNVALTYQSKYVWRGFDIYRDKSAIQPEVDMDLYGSGLGINVKAHRANSSGFEAAEPGKCGERWDYNLYYQNVYEYDTLTTNYRLGWVYYNYPDNASEDYDLQELHAVLSWPKLLGVEGLVPSYVLVKLWPSSSGSLVGSRATGNGSASGWAHIFMLDYPLSVPGLMPEDPQQILNLHSELVFNDGVHPGCGDVDHDWSNFVFGVSTDFDLDDNWILTPAAYHQMTMDTSVNPDKDETWITLALRYTF